MPTNMLPPDIADIATRLFDEHKGIGEHPKPPQGYFLLGILCAWWARTEHLEGRVKELENRLDEAEDKITHGCPP